MDGGTLAFLGVVAVIAANQVVMRVAALWRSPWAFWGLQAGNLAVTCWILVWGIPGLENFPIVSWALGLLLMFRMVQNNLLRASFLRSAKQEEHAEEKRAWAREQAVRLAREEAEAAGERLAAEEAAGAEEATEAAGPEADLATSEERDDAEV